MRRVLPVPLLLLLLAGCAGGPRALGITGPQGSSFGTAPGPPTGGDPLDNPSALESGTRYAPSIAPTTGSGRYWGYN